MVVAAGRATEDEGSPPYWPFLQVFRALGRETPVEMSPGRRPSGWATVPDGVSPQRRFRLFEAATGALVAEAEPGGLLVTLDDVQWADSASLRLLVHLSTALASSRLMVLVTYRDTETAGQEPLRAAVAALAREPAVTRMRLTGLDESEVATLLSGVTGWEVPASVASAVCRRTQGNPFFVGELGRLLTSSLDGQLPDGVRDAVRDRLNRLVAAVPRSRLAPAPYWGPMWTPRAGQRDRPTARRRAGRAGRGCRRRHRRSRATARVSRTTSSARRRGSRCPPPNGSRCTGAMAELPDRARRRATRGSAEIAYPLAGVVAGRRRGRRRSPGPSARPSRR